MSSSQTVDGFMTQEIWKPSLIKLTAADADSCVGGTFVYVDPNFVYHIRRIPVDKDGHLKEEVTYVYCAGTGVYVREMPEEVARLREAAIRNQPALGVVK